MARSQQYHSHPSIFRPIRLWLQVKSALLLALGGGCGLLAVQTAQRAWLSGLLVCLLLLLALTIRHNAQALIIGDRNLVYRSGVLSVQQQVIPLWRINVETRQTLLGRLLDYGTVVLHIDDELVRIRHIAMIEHFRDTIVARQDALMDASSSMWFAASRGGRFSRP